jgi:hypothetical protein
MLFSGITVNVAVHGFKNMVEDFSLVLSKKTLIEAF